MEKLNQTEQGVQGGNNQKLGSLANGAVVAERSDADWAAIAKQYITDKDASPEQCRDAVKFWMEKYRGLENAFAREADNARIDLEEFEKIEEGARKCWNLAGQAEIGAKFESVYDKDRFKSVIGVKPEQTIEAYAGEFYLRRQRALNEAITGSDDPDREKDLAIVQDLYRRIGEHIYYETDYETKQFDANQYQHNRRRAHNALIRQLNKMNDLAEKYGVRRFTFRNFITNDFSYDEHKDIGGYTLARASYDRTIVETYCRNAFSSEYDRAMRDFNKHSI